MEKLIWEALRKNPFTDDSMQRVQLLKQALNNGANPNVIHPKKGFTPLLCAIFGHQPQMVKVLIQHGADINLACQKITPLEAAIQSHSHDCLSLLLQNNVQLYPDNMNPITYAIAHHNLTAVWRLEDAGVDINKPSGLDQNTPLMCAVLFEDDARYTYNILQLKPNPNIADREGNTPLFAAICKQSIEKIDLLLEAKANVNHSSNLGFTPLFFAACIGNERIVSMLLHAGADVHHRDHNGETALHVTANMQIANLLIKAGADIKAQNKRGFTPFITAVQNGADDVVQYYIQQGQNVNIRDNFGNSLLMTAISHQQPSVTKTLIRAHINLDTQNRDGYSPLIYSVISNQPKITYQLTKAGANIHLTDRKGNNALIYAIQQKSLASAKVLLEHGSDPNSYDFKGSSALMLALVNTPEIVPLLIQKGADINCKDDNGFTPLMIAACMKDKQNVKNLLNAGADVSAVNPAGQTFRNISNFGVKLTYCQHILPQKLKSVFSKQQNQR